MSRKKAKICQIVRDFIKVLPTMARVTVNIAVWINSAGLGLDSQLLVHARTERKSRSLICRYGAHRGRIGESA